MPLGTEVGLGRGDVVIDRDPAPPTERGTAAPTFQATALAQLPISATAEFVVTGCGKQKERDSGLVACLTAVTQLVGIQREKKKFSDYLQTI